MPEAVKKNVVVWEGIFKDFPNIPASVAFDQRRWIDEQYKLTKKILGGNVKKAGGSILRDILAGCIAIKGNDVRILDFGGGIGIEFLIIAQSGMPMQYLQFDIVETFNLCRKGKEILGHIKQLNFLSELPYPSQSYDVFHAANSIHYIKDWRSFFGQICKITKNVIVLAGVTAGPIPTFSTIQNYYGIRMPVWFWNESDIISEFKKHGFELILKYEADALYFGNIRDLPMDNFPKTHRLQRKCNMVYPRKNL